MRFTELMLYTAAIYAIGCVVGNKKMQWWQTIILTLFVMIFLPYIFYLGTR